jgi:protein involved in polysaccharide export with SLBB domain
MDPQFRISVCAAALIVSAVAPAAGVAQQAQAPVITNGASEVGGSAPPRPGDVIQITSWREPALAGDYPVADDGTVNLPLLGIRAVSDLAPEALVRDLEADYGAKFRTEKTVTVAVKRRVRVLGAVREPGLYFVDRTMTVADAVALAGGAAEGGNWKEVDVFRDGRKLRVELDAANDPGQPVQSGDQIVLPEKGWFSRNGSVVLGASISAVAFLVTQALLR